MSAFLRRMTIAEFVAWEDQQPDKHEFDGFSIRAMTGGTRAHATIQRNIIAALHVRLRGRPCEVFGRELKIEVAGSVRYPDALVVCARGPAKATLVGDPVAVFEILSPSSARIDRVDKLREYRLTPSIVRYVMVEPDVIAATVFSRAGDDWAGRLRGEADVLDMPEIGVVVPLSEFYEGLAMSPEPDAP